MIWGIVPAKLSRIAKNRLTGHLSGELRAALSRAMLQDVLACLLKVEELASVVVVSADDEILELAARVGARALREGAEPRGLNSAVAQAAASCADQGASGVLIAMGDLPLLAPGDVRSVLRLVLAPSASQTGTNLLAMRPPTEMPTFFGPDSFRLHLEAARVRDLEIAICQAHSAAVDVDTFQDLVHILEVGDPQRATVQLLSASRRRGEWLPRPSSQAG
jgi:2-phospho-L-lactate/phosphoenolpyruvate guanylyltransferase